MELLIEKLLISQIEEIYKLFFDCFKNDSYYLKNYPDLNIKNSKTEIQFKESIKFCVKTSFGFGICIDKKLIAICLIFDYKKTKYNNYDEFKKIFGINIDNSIKYKNEIHDKINILGSNVIYLLSLCVDVSYRNKGIASYLVDFIIKNYSNYYIVGDVSNSGSLQIYTKKGFDIDKIDNKYFFIKRCPTIKLSEINLSDKNILLLPDKKSLNEIFKNSNRILKEITIHGYKIIGSKIDSVFIKSPTDTCTGYYTILTYLELLEYQRYINLCNNIEECINIPKIGICLIYHNIKYRENLIWNNLLRDMILTRSIEWQLIPDIYVMVPIEYKYLDRISSFSTEYSNQIITLLNTLDYRTHYESGIPKSMITQNKYNFRERIKRFYLGKFLLKVTLESSIDTYNVVGSTIGKPADVDLIISIDKVTKCGILSIVSLSTPFLISHYMDNVIRNEIYIYNNNIWTNLYDFLEQTLSINKRGTPKLYLTIPRRKDFLSDNQISSLLMSETIYSLNEGLGNVTDKEILNIVKSPSGMGQYDRAFVCVHSNVFIQFIENFQQSVTNRLLEEAITFTYIEFILFEDASISIVENNIVSCLNDSHISSTMKFLKRTLDIQQEYSKTIEFWDIQVNYPSSQKSIAMIRKAFNIDNHRLRMQKKSEELEKIFKTKRDIKDRTEASILNYIILFLTLMQGISTLFPKYFFGEFTNFSKKVSGLSIILFIVIIYYFFKNIIGKSKY